MKKSIEVNLGLLGSVLALWEVFYIYVFIGFLQAFRGKLTFNYLDIILSYYEFIFIVIIISIIGFIGSFLLKNRKKIGILFMFVSGTFGLISVYSIILSNSILSKLDIFFQIIFVCGYLLLLTGGIIGLLKKEVE